MSYPAPTVTIASETISEGPKSPKKFLEAMPPMATACMKCMHEVHWNLQLSWLLLISIHQCIPVLIFFFLMLYTQWIYSVFGDLLLLCNNRDGDISYSSEAQAQVLVSEVVCDEIDMM